MRTAAYHQSSNGQAERNVQTVKNGLLSNSKCYVDLNHRLDSFLMAYRSTPHTVTGETPSERFLGRTIMTKLDLIKPKSKIEVIAKVLKNNTEMQRYEHYNLVNILCFDHTGQNRNGFQGLL